MCTSHFQWFAVIFVFIVCLNQHGLTASAIDDRTSMDQANADLTSSSWNSDESFYLKRFIPDSKQWTRRDLWSRFFRADNRPVTYSHQSPAGPAAGSNHLTSVGRIRIIPFDKRGIPIELQKALYAHGIVGRRR